MQLKLLPPSPLPTVLFTLAYPAPPSTLPLPLSYAHLLKLIVDENLLDSAHNILERVDGPHVDRQAGVGLAAGLGAETREGSLTPHALDRATWLAAVLAEVVFDLSAVPSLSSTIGEEEVREISVSARYVDTRCVSFVLRVVAHPKTQEEEEARRCYDALMSVLGDVTESAAAGERERRAREVRHAYAQDGVLLGEWERYDRYPSPGLARSHSWRGQKRERERDARRSLDELGMSREAGVSVEGFVETRRGKGRKREVEEKVEGEEKKEKKKHKKKPSLLMSIVAFASNITSRTRTPPSSPSTPTHLLPAPIPSIPEPEPELEPEPVEPHVVHPQLPPLEEPTLSASDLRRRARATLVDVFRRHVLAALKGPLALPAPDAHRTARSLTARVRCVSYEGLGADEEQEEEVAFGRANEGGYVTWVTRSLLARVEAEMREMRAVRCVGSRLGFTPVESGVFAWEDQTIADEVPPFGVFDGSFEGEHAKIEDMEGMEDVPLDDVDATSMATDASTETDGSSVHTPSESTSFDQAQVLSPSTPPSGATRDEYFSHTDGHAADFDAAPLSSSPPRRPVLTKRPSLPITKSTQMVPRSPSPPFRPSLSLTTSPSQSPPPQTSALPLAAYTALSGERLRLRSILTRLASQHATAQADDERLLAVLEKKSRRRAWSNCAFMGGAHVAHVALSVPERRSPLGTARVIGAGEASFRADGVEGREGVRGKKRGLVVTTAESNILRLFPVCEEDEDPLAAHDVGDEAFCADVGAFGAEGEAGGRDAPYEQDAVLSDAESGLLGPLGVGFAPLTRQTSRRCSVPVRPRTTSMCKTGPLLPAPVTTSSSYPGTYSLPHESLVAPYSRASRSTDNLLLDSERLFEPQTKVELFDVYSDDEDDGSSGDEFTLSMDLPALSDSRLGASSWDARQRREREEWFSA